MNKSKGFSNLNSIFPNKVVSTILIFLVLINILAWSGFAYLHHELGVARAEAAKVGQNKKIANFQKLFVEKVLNSDGVVDYETRKLLEQSVADTNNESVIRAWKAFVSATTEAEGQIAVKNLLLVITEAMGN